MEKYIYINYAHEDQDKVMKIIRKLKAAGIAVAYGNGSEEKVAGSSCVIHFCTAASRTSRSYRKIMNYTLKHELDTMLFHMEGTAIASDVEIQLDILHSLFKYKYAEAADATASAGQSEVTENRRDGEAETTAVTEAVQKPETEPAAVTEAAHEEQREPAAAAEAVHESEKTEAAASAETAQEPEKKEPTAAAEAAHKPEGEQAATEPAAQTGAAEHETGIGENQAGAGEAVQETVKAVPAAEPTKEELFMEGRRLMTGDGRDVDVDRAFRYFRQAASMGHVEAQYQLSVCYDRGIGVRRSIVEAAKWCQMAAYGGHAQAQSEIGYCYEYGQGVVRNIKEAVRWYEIASEQGNVEAKNNLAFCYQKGKGVAKDMRRALRLYGEAADAGHASAQYNLAYCYWYGEGVKSDKTRAIQLFEKAAANGNAKASQMLKILNQQAYMRKRG